MAQIGPAVARSGFKLVGVAGRLGAQLLKPFVERDGGEEEQRNQREGADAAVKPSAVRAHCAAARQPDEDTDEDGERENGRDVPRRLQREGEQTFVFAAVAGHDFDRGRGLFAF